MRRPKLVISKCLNSEKCRYDGQGYDDKVISLLREYVDIESVCPEKEIGLTVPRDPIRIEKDKDKYKLIQLKTNSDYTRQMNEFAEEFLSELGDTDGFIFKSKSPSCGINNVKIYTKNQRSSISKKGIGFFSSKIIDKYHELPIEDEGRLKNYNIRDEFLTKIFTINNLKAESNISKFHKKNILLLKSYSEDMSDELEFIINKQSLNDEDINIYKNKVYEILEKKRSKNSKINVCEIVFEKYKSNLNINEIEYFEKIVRLCKEEKIPLSSLMIALQIYAVRFDDLELLNQTFFNPYPEGLLSICDSGKGRNI